MNYNDEMYKLREALKAKVMSTLTQELVDLQYRVHSMGMDVYSGDNSLVNIIKRNVDNKELSDAEFREFVRNSTKD